MTPAKPDSLLDDLQSLSDDLDDASTAQARSAANTSAEPETSGIDALVDELVGLHLPAIEAELRDRLSQLGNDQLRALLKRGQ